MTTDPDFDRYAREWLEDGPVQLADPVLDATLVAVHRTTQQHRQSFGRFTVSFTSPRLIAAAVIVLLVAGGAVGIADAAIAGGCRRPALTRRLGASAIGQPRSRARAPPRPPRCSPTRTPTSSRWTRATRARAPTRRRAGSRCSAPATRTAVSSDIAVDGDLRDPAWSPDGSQIAFVAATPTGATLWTAAADGSNPTKVATCARPCASIDRPAWSPDGKQLVFTETDKAQGLLGGTSAPPAARIVVLTLAGGARTVVVEGRPDALPADASWSPHGDTLVYDRLEVELHGRVDGSSIWTIGADGTGDSQMAGMPAGAGEPAWSATDVVAFSDGINILTVPVGGGTPTKVTNLSEGGQQANSGPGWTRDGRISYVHAPTNGATVLMSVAADGSDPAVIFSGGGRTYPGRPAALP